MPGIPKIVAVPPTADKKLAIRIAPRAFYVVGDNFLTDIETSGLLCEAEIRDMIGISEEIIFEFRQNPTTSPNRVPL